MADNLDDGIFRQWVGEAKKEVYNKGWKEASVNALLLLCHDMTASRDKRLFDALRGPIRWFVGICAAGLVWVVVSGVLGL